MSIAVSVLNRITFACLAVALAIWAPVCYIDYAVFLEVWKGPCSRFWYGILYKYVGGSSPKVIALKKVLLDQCLYAPAFLCSFLIVLGITQGKDWNAIKQNIKLNYKDILIANYYVWPWVQILNFYYIPLQYQVLLVQTVALFWSTYLAWKTNRVKV